MNETGDVKDLPIGKEHVEVRISDGVELNKAFAISQLCYDFALMPEGSRDPAISDMRLSLEMDSDRKYKFCCGKKRL